MTNLDNSKHNDIIEAAFTQFIQYGFQKTTMADIAVATGISRPSIYTYFENKEEILKQRVFGLMIFLMKKLRRFWIMIMKTGK